MFRIAFVLFLSVLATLTAAQTPVPGSSDPRFAQAVQEWLSGDERDGLHTLSALADEHNIAAKILVSRIADTPNLSDHISRNLNRKDRINLFREPKGLSGRDWLASAAEENDLARALWATQFLEAGDRPDLVTVVVTLLAYGETRILLRYLLETWKHDRLDIAIRTLLENDALFGAAGRDFLGFALQTMLQDGKQPPFPAEIDTDEKALTYLQSLRRPLHQFAYSGFYPFAEDRTAVPSQPDGQKALADAVRTLPELQPLTLFCETTCRSSQQEACLADTAWAVAATGAFPHPFSSPAQSLISDETYLSSSRFSADLRRTLRLSNWPGCRP